MNEIKNVFRHLLMKSKQKKLKNKNPSIISSNCIGCILSHELGLRFNSPFVNLWLYPKDFLKYLENIERYQGKQLRFIEKPGITYPVAKLDDIEIYFQHYKTPKEAEEKWVERSKRINLDNLFIIMTDRDGCTYEDLERFERLKYPHKVCFTHKKYDELPSTLFVKEFENQDEVGKMHEYKNRFSLKKHFDTLDYITWLNGESVSLFTTHFSLFN